MKTTAKVTEALESLLSAFESGQVTQAIAHTVIDARPVPMAQWSFHNQVMIYLSGTTDARGYRQWNEVGRHVKKGSRALYILVPLMRKRKDADENDDNARYTYGFKCAPVFALEDTDGDPLPDNEDLAPPQAPPLTEVALAWNIPVEYIPFARSFYGTYQFDTIGASEKILLCTHDESTFFHELAHAAHRRTTGHIKPGQDWKQEIVAELTAAVLGRLFNRQTDGRSFQYIRSYAQDAGQDAHKACITVLTEVKAVLDLILSTAEQIHTETLAAD